MSGREELGSSPAEKRANRTRRFRLLTRGGLVWLLLMASEVVHGVLRAVILVPWLGEFRSDQLGVLSGSLLILAIVFLTIDWLPVKGRGELLCIGAAWTTLTLGFEFVLGRLLLGISWADLLSSYDLRQGGLMPLGLTVLWLSPLIAHAIRQKQLRQED